MAKRRKMRQKKIQIYEIFEAHTQNKRIFVQNKENPIRYNSIRISRFNDKLQALKLLLCAKSNCHPKSLTANITANINRLIAKISNLLINISILPFLQ